MECVPWLTNSIKLSSFSYLFFSFPAVPGRKIEHLYGESPEKIAFLRRIIEDAPGSGFEAFWGIEEDGNAVRIGESCYLFYFGARQPAERVIFLPEDKRYRLEIIDAWAMTLSPVEGVFSGSTLVKLPGKPYTALRAVLVQ